MRIFLAALLGLLATLSSGSTRTVLPFNSGWQFAKGDPAEAPWQEVRLPHTWNDRDVLPGGQMYQGSAWYRKEFTAPTSWEGKRVFVRFGAASLTAEVLLNGALLGEHRGGFTAFCFELTSGLHLGERNLLSVRVDNHRGTVSPLSGDFSVFGGLYRPASLIVTGQVAISPLDSAGPGVYLRQVQVGPDHAGVAVTTKVSNRSGRPCNLEARVSVLDAKGRAVLRSNASATVPEADVEPISQTLVLEHPHLWNGVADPYLYTVRVELLQAGRKVDQVEQPLGLRSFHVDPERGFVLNGKPFQIHGVCMHQDGGSMGWAVSEQDERSDLKIVREMGVNGVRLAHYPHSESFHSLCDHEGVLVWSELALVNHLRGTKEFVDNLRQQLTEQIRQNYNHPSIVIWSMYNEIGSDNKDAPGPIIKELSDLAHAEDPDRMTSGAASGDTMNNLPDVMQAPDLVSLNLYPGWYVGQPSDLSRDIDRFNRRYGSEGVSVSEYGGGASIHQHEQGMTKRPVPNSRWHPEEWQAILHEQAYPQIASRPYVWGSFLWVMFDFPSTGRHEGDADGINDKGLVTRDRKVRKDAYYFYQANWTTKPMVYITSRRDTARKSLVTDIKVYSNCDSVSLSVNGHSYGQMPSSAPHVFLLKAVMLDNGTNRVEVEGALHGETVRDSCDWNCDRQAGSQRTDHI